MEYAVKRVRMASHCIATPHAGLRQFLRELVLVKNVVVLDIIAKVGMLLPLDSTRSVHLETPGRDPKSLEPKQVYRHSLR